MGLLVSRAELLLNLPGMVVTLPALPLFLPALTGVLILPGKVVTFEEAKPDLEKKMLKERAQGAIFDLHDKIEDERAAGLAPSGQICQQRRRGKPAVEPVARPVFEDDRPHPRRHVRKVRRRQRNVEPKRHRFRRPRQLRILPVAARPRGSRPFPAVARRRIAA